MSIETTTMMSVNVPTKTVAGKLAYSISHDYNVMEIEMKTDAKGHVHLYIDGQHIFTEPGE